MCVPLQGICILSRGKENVIHRAEAGSVIEILRHQAYGDANALVDRLAELVPLWEMECNTQPDAVQVSYSAMSCASVKDML